jgi:hypothetical protein
MPVGEINKARDAREMTNDCIDIAANSEGLDDCCEDDVGGSDDGSCAMIVKDLFHGMTYPRVCTKWRDDGIHMDFERKGFTDNGLSSENKPRKNIGMHGSNGMKPVSDSHKDTPNTRGKTTFSYPDCKDEKGGASAEFTLTTANIRDCIAVVGAGRVMAKLYLWA